MERRNFFAQVLMMLLAALVMSLPALAQVKPGILRIHEVSKRDVADAPAGQKKLVPVFVKASIEDGELQDAKVVGIIAELVTLNTDGTKTRITEKYEQFKPLLDMKLPMANGVFAKSYTLTVRVTILRNGKREIANTAKSGNF